MCSHQRLDRSWYRAGTYQIRVRGSLRASWSDRLAGMQIRPDDGDLGCTLLEGPLPDQAALLGVLKGLYDLGMPLLHVERIEGDEEGRCDSIE
jgi:hypothetical protein